MKLIRICSLDLGIMPAVLEHLYKWFDDSYTLNVKIVVVVYFDKNYILHYTYITKMKVSVQNC